MRTSFVGNDGAMPSKYDENTKARAVRLVREHRDDYDDSEWGAMKAIAGWLGMHTETLRKWCAKPRSTPVKLLGCPARRVGSCGSFVFIWLQHAVPVPNSVVAAAAFEREPPDSGAVRSVSHRQPVRPAVDGPRHTPVVGGVRPPGHKRIPAVRSAAGRRVRDAAALQRLRRRAADGIPDRLRPRQIRSSGGAGGRASDRERRQ